MGKRQQSFGVQRAACSIPVFDVRPQYLALKEELDAAIGRVLDRGWFIQGEEHAAFEAEFAAFCGARHGVGVASGTDAIRIALQAIGVEPGDEVVAVANAGVPPIAAIVETGARPVFVDVDPATRTLDPDLLEAALSPRTRAVLAVHLYGQSADVDRILELIRPRGIALLEDCAQAHGAEYRGKRVGSLGDAAAFSFYPTKNLGAYGDGGLITTSDDGVADRARLLRQYGWRRQYLSETHGISSRLDELQAAILRVKLRHLEVANDARRLRAARYTESLRGVITPAEPAWSRDVYHLYVVEVADRDGLKAALAERGVGTGIHYPLPAHLQEPYAELGAGLGSLPVTERLASRVLSLPMFPELPLEQVDYVAEAVNEFSAAHG
ncbi:MAG: DegT/DnrJ/EryC1/StrS family aminotransferase [Chloroflexi bacterium]|nr:DegT/DnrJ/EryC1/StrS family aminotransferase [Chloroflexota bacterium]